jgi:uncharacterized protein
MITRSSVSGFLRTPYPLARALVALCAAIGLAGCGLLRSPNTTPTTFYVLSSTAQTGDARSGRPLTLGVGPISMPPYLERPQLVKRVAPNELTFNEFDRWSEPLKENFTRVLGTDLDKLVHVERLIAYPWYSSTKMDYAIEINILRFEPQPDGEVVLDARWSIRGAQTSAFHNRELHLSRPGGSASDVAAAMSSMTGELAQNIANGLRELDARSGRN